MKIKTEQTFELTQGDIRAAIVAYITTLHGIEAKDANVQLKIDGGSPYYGPLDEGRPASVEATVVIQIESEAVPPAVGGGIRVRV